MPTFGEFRLFLLGQRSSIDRAHLVNRPVNTRQILRRMGMIAVFWKGFALLWKFLTASAERSSPPPLVVDVQVGCRTQSVNRLSCTHLACVKLPAGGYFAIRHCANNKAYAM